MESMGLSIVTEQDADGSEVHYFAVNDEYYFDLSDLLEFIASLLQDSAIASLILEGLFGPNAAPTVVGSVPVTKPGDSDGVL